MKLISIATSLSIVIVLAYFWIVVRVFIGTQEFELAVWKSPYLYELFVWLIIGVPLVLFFQTGHEEELEENKTMEESPEKLDLASDKNGKTESTGIVNDEAVPQRD